MTCETQAMGKVLGIYDVGLCYQYGNPNGFCFAGLSVVLINWITRTITKNGL
ncbi:hypothetical protein SAMN05421780_102136 [Flexibacter flexilis DSM 6793]|uniref:Uncharacterized protein n=1 Tax=Flexibacter flexilis DSM 6793 TaxID=927664 RepID=A0A1I1FCJ4_9BACT|nr:hypothetical protein SAMN05421780_102136 [Flexibacter flexilis DSM 6793]